MSFIEIKDVVKQYSGHRALDGVSMDIAENSIYGLLGPNGAGKTTLIRIVNHITAPDSGEVLLNGKVLTADDVCQIGYLPEERGLYKKMKVGEQALFLARLKGMSKSDAQKALKFWFEKFEIQAWWNKKVEELSKGMAQKVQFITTVLHEPKLLIFDEPFSGFDPVNADLLKNEILELKKKGSTIIFSTHNMASVEELCDSISLIDHSKIVLQGDVNQIRKENATQKYELIVRQPIASNGYAILSVDEISEGIKYILKKDEGRSSNQILNEIIQQTEIVSFREILPTMHEIFIKTVNK